MERGPLQIAPSEVDAGRNALQTLEEHRREVEKMTRQYPVICEFSDRRFILRNAEDVSWLIEQLRALLKEEDTRIAAMPGWAQGVFAAITPSASH